MLLAKRSSSLNLNCWLHTRSAPAEPAPEGLHLLPYALAVLCPNPFRSMGRVKSRDTSPGCGLSEKQSFQFLCVLLPELLGWPSLCIPTMWLSQAA